MSLSNEYQQWVSYCRSELESIRPILKHNGYTLDEHQPHIGGERYLHQAVTTKSGRKLILLGTSKEGRDVVIKATSDEAGKRELEHDRLCRDVLHKINFAYQVFLTPNELAFIEEQVYTIVISEFIEHQHPFLERAIEEQFDFALKSFKAQESAHATTFSHRNLIRKVFGFRDVDTYLNNYKKFQNGILEHIPDDIAAMEILEHGWQELTANRETIEQYSGFLTHTDFVPHNFRIKDKNVYLLDSSSLSFGNKYEGWARFLNFMVLYNQELEQLLVEYVKNNRTPEESVSLRLMRIYRLAEISWFYVQAYQKSEGDLKKLNHARIQLWLNLQQAILNNMQIDQSILETYKKTRDSLRSDEELERQKGLH